MCHSTYLGLLSSVPMLLVAGVRGKPGTPGRPRCPATMIRRKHHDPYSQEEAADLEALALGDSGTGAALEANEGKAWAVQVRCL